MIKPEHVCHQSLVGKHGGVSKTGGPTCGSLMFLMLPCKTFWLQRKSLKKHMTTTHGVKQKILLWLLRPLLWKLRAAVSENCKTTTNTTQQILKCFWGLTVSTSAGGSQAAVCWKVTSWLFFSTRARVKTWFFHRNSGLTVLPSEPVLKKRGKSLLGSQKQHGRDV